MSELIDRTATKLHDTMCRQDIDGYLRADIDCGELAIAAVEEIAQSIEDRYGELHPGCLFLRRMLNEHRDGLNGQARNPAGLPDSSGDLASAGGIAGVDIKDHRRQVGTPRDGLAAIPHDGESP